MGASLLAEIRERPEMRFSYRYPDSRSTNVGIGLGNHGPYDRDLPDRPKTCGLGLIYPLDWQKSADEFKNQFLNGYAYLRGGFQEFFKLDDVEITMYPVEFTEKGYQEGTNQVLASEHDIALVLVSEKMKLRDFGPYWISKAFLTNRGLPSQMLKIETINDSVVFRNSIVNLASQIYAKLGGIPWVIHDPVSDADIIIGVGESKYRRGRYGAEKKAVGFTTAYKNNGAYLWFGSISTISDSQSFDKDLSENIVKSVDRYEDKEKKKAKKVVIHSYKRIGYAEKLAVQKLKEKENIKVVLAHVNRSHNLRIFDPDDSTGLSRAGLIVQNADTECLVLSVGRGRLRGERAANTPLWVKTYPNGADFEPVKLVARNIYDLCYVRWEDQFGAAEPVTIGYSEDIAEMLQKMDILRERGEAGIAPPLVHPKLEKIPWFI